MGEGKGREQHRERRLDDRSFLEKEIGLLSSGNVETVVW